MLEDMTSKMRHHVAKLAEAATTPLVPADFFDLFAPLRAGADLRGRIEQVIPETRDAATLVIRPGADWAGHVPGQYVRIGIDVDGVRQWRAYSLTHGPRPDGRIAVTVKAVPDGLVSHHLVHDTRPGTMVHLEQAAGEFVLPPEGGHFLFVTAGSGITPVIGMLRNLFPSTDEGVLRPNRTAHHDVVVVHVAPSRPDSIFIHDLEALAAAGAIKLVTRYDDVHGVLDVEELPALVPDLAERRTFACGPAGLLDALGHYHADKGLQLFTEQFRTGAGRAGRRRQRHLRRRPHRLRRRRDPDPRRRRGRRRPDAERLPDGHLLRLRAADEGGQRPRPPQRRDHHRGARRERRRQDPDLHQRARRRVPPRPLNH